MDAWVRLLDVLILLTAALLLGALAERLRQSAIIGYLLAGMLVGPNVLGWVPGGEEVDLIAELGAALLLFTIGLEFSLRRLRRMGSITLLGGGLQVVLTGALGSALALAAGLDGRPAVALGAAVALSSTAFVLRVLVDTMQTDSLRGRNAIAILLFQDMAVVPVVLLVTALGGAAGPREVAADLLRTLLVATLAFGVLFLVLSYLLPPFLRARGLSRNRELPVLLTVVVALGTAWGAHAIDVSPAIGAFAAGLVLAESPFAIQIRADIAALRTLLITLFFAAVGMFGDPAWAAANLGAVAVLVALVIVGKALVVAGVLRVLGYSGRLALATGLALAQIGEFSFVVAQVAAAGGLFDQDLLRLVLSATLVTLFLTPYLFRLGSRVLSERAAPEAGEGPGEGRAGACPGSVGHVIVVGFGPAGQEAAGALQERWGAEVVTVDLNAKNAVVAHDRGIQFHIGDATHPEVLEHLRLDCAAAVVVTTPDPVATRRIVRVVRALAPQAGVAVRARYHLSQQDLYEAGAEVVVDEESEVGLSLARRTGELLLPAASSDSGARGPETVGGGFT